MWLVGAYPAVGATSDPISAGGMSDAARKDIRLGREPGSPSDQGESAPGRMTLQWRPRFNYIDQTNKPRRAEAYNMRLLLGFRTYPTNDVQLTAELVNVSWLNPIRANDQPGNSASPYPLVSDPDKTDLNLFFLDFTQLSNTRVRVGRQAIKLDNERFVGDADVRQMPQVFDAVSIRNSSLPDTEVFAAYAWQMRTYFGNVHPVGTAMLNLRRDFESGMSLGAYSYLSDQPVAEQRTGMLDNGNSIVGMRIEGNFRASEQVSFYYAAEHARQRAYANGDRRIRANYHRLAAGPSWGNYSMQIGEERLGSNRGQYGFQTPLSYNTFQGWAYEFLNTPRDGVRDRSVAFFATLDRASLALKHHWFDADFGPLRYGREWDVAVSYRIATSWSLRGVFANFRGDAAFFRPSANRYYVTLQYDLN